MLRRFLQSAASNVPSAGVLSEAVLGTQLPAAFTAAQRLSPCAADSAPGCSYQSGTFACDASYAFAYAEDALHQQRRTSWPDYLQRKAWELILPMPAAEPEDSIMMTSQQTYKPKVYKRKRCHGFLKRCAPEAPHALVPRSRGARVFRACAGTSYQSTLRERPQKAGKPRVAECPHCAGLCVAYVPVRSLRASF